MKCLLASLKRLTDSKSCSESSIQFLFRLSFALIGQFFLVYIHSWLSEQFSESQASFGTTFKGTGSYQKAGKSSLKRVTGRNFTISKWFHRSKQKLHFGFPSQKDNWKLWKPFRITSEFSEQLLKAQAAIRKPKQALWRGLLEGISQLVSDFIEASRNFILNFLHKKTTENCENHKRSFKKYCFEF